MKKNCKYILLSALLHFIFFFCLFIDAKPVHAAVNDKGITISGVSYNIQTKELKLKISRDDGEKGLKYYVAYNFEDSATRFENAISLDSASGEVILTQSGDLYVWKENASKNDYCHYYSKGSIESVLMEDFFHEIDVISNTVLDSKNYPITFDFKKGEASCIIPCGMMFHISLFGNDGTFLGGSATFRHNIGSGIDMTNTYNSTTHLAQERINESGTYTYRVMLYNEEEGYYCDLGDYKYEYTRPEVSLPKVDYVKWNKEETGKVVIGFPEKEENMKGYRLILERRRGNSDENWWRYGLSIWDYFDGNALQYDFSRFFYDGNEYRVGVQTLSNEIETYAHSEYVYSDIYNPATASEDVIENIADVLGKLGVDSIEKVNADSLQEIYDKATEEEKANIVSATKGALEDLAVNELKVSMQVDADVRNLVSTIEQLSGASVEIDVDENIQNMIEKESISLIGAGLNAQDPSEPVQVKISSSDVVFDSIRYKNAIPLEISLDGVKVTEETLAIPVMVSMKIPEGINMEKVVVLHHRADGSLDEKIHQDSLYKDYANREIRFTVTHFSPFVIAEEQIADIIKAQLYIGQDFKLLYKANVDKIYSSVQMRFSSPLCNRVVDGTYDSEAGNYYFEFTGIGPQCLADNIDVKLLCDGNVMDTRTGFSVKAYCDTVAAKSAADLNMTEEQFEKLKTLMADMLEYGAEAQKYANHSTESLANTSPWVAESKTKDYIAPKDYVFSSETPTGDNRIKSVALDIRSVNKIVFKVNVASENTVKAKVYNLTKGAIVEEKELSEVGEHLIYTDAIYATGYDEVYEIELVDRSGNILHSLKFSSSAYVNSTSEDPSIGNLVKRLYIYGRSAQNYRK